MYKHVFIFIFWWILFPRKVHVHIFVYCLTEQDCLQAGAVEVNGDETVGLFLFYLTEREGLRASLAEVKTSLFWMQVGCDEALGVCLLC